MQKYWYNVWKNTEKCSAKILGGFLQKHRRVFLKNIDICSAKLLKGVQFHTLTQNEPLPFINLSTWCASYHTMIFYYRRSNVQIFDTHYIMKKMIQQTEGVIIYKSIETKLMINMKNWAGDTKILSNGFSPSLSNCITIFGKPFTLPRLRHFWTTLLRS